MGNLAVYARSGYDAEGGDGVTEDGGKKPEWKTRLVKGRFPGREFDIEVWKAQGDAAIFSAAWEMLELAEEMKHGGKPTLQRTVTKLKRL